MKGNIIPIIISFFILIFGIIIGCVSISSNNTESISSYFTGSGGKEMRLGIILPQSQGLNENQDYLPLMIQGVLVSNISKYSAISVLDRVSLDRVIMETLNPTYEDNLDIVRLGHVAQVGYIMTGNIIKTSTGFSLQINVTDTTANATTIASYAGNFSTLQLDDHTAINRASLELLNQIGVKLTASAKNELVKASTHQNINAQTALAQGIAADRKGQKVEAVLHYFDASTLEVTATEALNRMSVATTSIATGSLGNQIRDDIQQRKDWIKLIDETNNYFINNPQYAIVELYYNSELNLSSINYTGEKASLKFPFKVHLNNEKANALTKIITNIKNGLNATGKKELWGIDVNIDPFSYLYTFHFELLNDKGKVISANNSFLMLTYNDNNFGMSPPEEELIFKKLGINDSSSRNKMINFLETCKDSTFTVKAADITDNLSIKLKNITVENIIIKPNTGLRILSYDYNYGKYSHADFTTISYGNNIIPVFLQAPALQAPFK